MNNSERLVYISTFFECLGEDLSHAIDVLNDFYLCKELTIKQFNEVLSDPLVCDLKSSKSIKIYKRFYNVYLSNDNNSTRDVFLNAKLKAYEKIYRDFGDGFSIEKLLKNLNNPFSKTVIGLANFYGLLNMKNTVYGKELLQEAGKDGCIDAEFWVLKNTQNDKTNILKEIAKSTEYISNADDLSAWTDYYKTGKLEVETIKVFKLGFN